MDYVINCKTEEQAKALMAILAKQGISWNNGERPGHNSRWRFYKDCTCYEVDDDGITYGSRKTFEKYGCDIIPFEAMYGMEVL